jgi:fatty acid desaturase
VNGDFNLQDRPYSQPPSSLLRDREVEHNPWATYSDLRRLVLHNRLLDRQPVYFASKIIFNTCLWAIGLTLTLSVRTIWLQTVIACYMAFVSTQIGFLVHDAGHQHISKTRWKNTLVGLIYTNILLGLSYSWWVAKHNQHHSKPNQSAADPDINFVLLAFSEEQAAATKAFSRFLVNHQAYFFFPLFFLEAFSLKFESWRFLMRAKSHNRLGEVLSLALHYIVFVFLLVHFLGLGRAIVFTLLYNALLGLSLGMVFVTNHVGRPILSKDVQMDFLNRQVVTARNLKAHWLTDYCFGLLGCQIEHHLFPAISRNRLRDAQQIIRPFCELHGIDYHETGVLQCYREIVWHLHNIGAATRKRIVGATNGQTSAD